MQKRKLEIYRKILIECQRIKIKEYLLSMTEKQFEPVVVGTPKVKKLGVWKKL